MSNNLHIIALQEWIYKFSIKDNVDEEDINDTTSLLKGIIFAIYSAKDNTLPEDFVIKLLKVMQTSSVPLFNEGFKRLENRLLSMPDSQVLGNTIESRNYILAYATTTHQK